MLKDGHWLQMPLPSPSVTKAREACSLCRLFVLGIYPEFILQYWVQCFSGKLVDIWGKATSQCFSILNSILIQLKSLKCPRPLWPTLSGLASVSNLIIDYDLKHLFHPPLARCRLAEEVLWNNLGALPTSCVHFLVVMPALPSKNPLIFIWTASLVAVVPIQLFLLHSFE